MCLLLLLGVIMAERTVLLEGWAEEASSQVTHAAHYLEERSILELSNTHLPFIKKVTSSTEQR